MPGAKAEQEILYVAYGQAESGGKFGQRLDIGCLLEFFHHDNGVGVDIDRSDLKAEHAHGNIYCLAAHH